MDNMKRFIECLIPISACNLKCEYCYVIQENRRKDHIPTLKYTPEQMGRCLTKKRMGGICYFSICGAGETLLDQNVPQIVRRLLENGHYVNITTNGTISAAIDKLLSFPKELLYQLHISFSLHYIELLRKNLINCFFENILKVKDSNASFLVQFNMCDSYIPYFNEINRLCVKHTGSSPQIAATRNELADQMSLYTKLSESDYFSLADPFDSSLFRYTMKNFMVKREEFCYAGDWSVVLDLSTGIVKRCYSDYNLFNIFENEHQPVPFGAIGNQCKSQYCINSSHFMSLGVIPELDQDITYSSLRNREGWQTEQMEAFLSGKLCNQNQQYSTLKKLMANHNIRSPKEFQSRIKNKAKTLFLNK